MPATHPPRTTLIDWLSSPENPPVRYLVARNMTLPAPPARELATRRREIFDWEPLQRILDLQLNDGSFPYEQKTHTAQPTFAALSLMQLCGLEATDEPVRRALDFLNSRHVLDGVLTYTGGGSGVLPCYVGVATTALIKMGAVESNIVQSSIRWLVDYQRFDSKQQRAGGMLSWPFRAPQNYGCWESVSCYHGVAGAFRAFAALPPNKRSTEVSKRLDEAIAYLQTRRLYKRTESDAPLFRHMTQFFLAGDYRYDLIDMLNGVADADPTLGTQPWVEAAIADVRHRTVDGKIILVKNYARKLIDPIPLEKVGGPSRFLTYQWLHTLQLFDAARSS